MQLSKFDEALQYIEKNNLNHLVFEKAYCQYRNNASEKALKTIEAVDEKQLTSNLKELKAQIFYRLVNPLQGTIHSNSFIYVCILTD